jgi:hypothetical protein
MSDWMKVQRPHDALPDDGWDYHEWVYLGERLLLDVLGRPNPRVWGSPSWQRWVCNNPDCHGSVVVHEEYVKALIDALPLNHAQREQHRRNMAWARARDQHDAEQLEREC